MKRRRRVVREWEEAKGREMTRAEKIDRQAHEAFLIKMSVTTQAQVSGVSKGSARRCGVLCAKVQR